VRALRASDQHCLAVGQTDAEGNYELRFSHGGEPYMIVADTQWGRSFDTSSSAACPELRPQAEVTGKTGDDIYSFRSGETAGDELEQKIDLRVPESQDSGAFNILDVMIQGFNWTTAMVGDNLPKLRARWTRGEQTFITDTSYYDTHQRDDAKNFCIFIKGPAHNTDEFDDSVIAHEFMHHVLTTLIGPGPGGRHGPTWQSVPTLAFHEGAATALGSHVLKLPNYYDSSTTGGFGAWIVGIETIDATAMGRTSPAGTEDGTQSGKVSEGLISYVLWDLLDSDTKEADDRFPGAELQTVGALFDYLPKKERKDRGGTDVDLVDFLDGWRCEDTESRR
jgi:hypothetical protein